MQVGDDEQPRRTCVGCRRVDAQASLRRIVRRGDAVVADVARRLAGRGAWLHPRSGCLDAALRNGAVLRALRLPPGFNVALRDAEHAAVWASHANSHGERGSDAGSNGR